MALGNINYCEEKKIGRQESRREWGILRVRIDKADVLNIISVIYDIEETESFLLHIFKSNEKYGVISCYGKILFDGICSRDDIIILRKDKRHILCIKDSENKEISVYKVYDNGCEVVLKMLDKSEFIVDSLLQEAIILRKGQVYKVANYKGLSDNGRYEYVFYHVNTGHILCIKTVLVHRTRPQLVDKIDIRNKRGKLVRTVLGWSDALSNYYMLGRGILHNKEIREVEVEYTQDHKKSIVKINGTDEVMAGIKLDNNLRHCIN